MNRFLVSLLVAFVIVAGCTEEASRILGPSTERALRLQPERLRSSSESREDSIHAADYAADVSLSSAGSIIVAAGSMDYSFTLRFRRFVGAACTGGSDLFTNVFGVSDFGFAIDFGTRLSVQLEAAAAANDGTPFHRWQGPASSSFATRTICVDVPAGVDTWVAFFEAGAANTPPVLASIGPQTIDELSTLQFSAAAQDGDIPAQALTFGLRNGTGLVPEGAAMNAAGAFTWTPSEQQGPGVFTFDVCVTDSAVPALEDCETVQVTVNEVNLPPVIADAGSFVVTESETVTFTAVASDPDLPDNILTFGLEGAPQGASIDPVTGEFDWTPADDAGSPFDFAVVVTDPLGASARTDVRVTVTNVAPVLAAMNGVPLAPIAVGVDVVLTGSFGDASPVDTHDVDVNCNHGGTVLAGIGSVDVERNWSGTCRYSTPGIYRVRARIVDDEGDSGEVVSDAIVVYDPEGGFITGGGWFESPAGAWIADPGLTGRAQFGFVSRYKPGVPSPGGNTEFTLKAADLRFRSTNYEWLVVAGSTARFRGTGEIDGHAGYHFEIDATDSKDGVDRIRVKIWNSATGTTVYDSGVGGNGPTAATLIQGSIVIHDGKTSTSQAGARK